MGDFEARGDPAIVAGTIVGGELGAATTGLPAALTSGEMAVCVGQWLWSWALADEEEEGVKMSGRAVTVGFAPLRALVIRAVMALGEGITWGRIGGLPPLSDLPGEFAPYVAEDVPLTWARAAAICEAVRGEPCTALETCASGERVLGLGEAVKLGRGVGGREGVEVREKVGEGLRALVLAAAGVTGVTGTVVGTGGILETAISMAEKGKI